MGAIWQSLFYQPLLNLLVYTYNIVGGDLGVAIILITLVIKLALYPLSSVALKSQKALQEIQPKVDALRVRYKDSKEDMARELMKLYQSEKVSPWSSCLPLLIQLPFLIALYQVFRHGLASEGIIESLYPFVQNPGTLNHMLLGVFDLAAASWPLAVITGLAQYWQTKMLIHNKPPMQVPGSKDESMAAAMNKQALYIMPILTVVLGFSLPGGLILYWLANTLLTIGQQYLVFKQHKPKLVATQ